MIPRTGGSKPYSEAGRRLRERREELGLSRQKLAELADLSYPYVAQLEGGHRAPSSDAARKLADVLGLSYALLTDLLAREKGAARGSAVPGYLPNPAFVAADARARTPAVDAVLEAAAQDLPAFVDEMTAMFDRLPVEQRLDALGRVQARVMTSVVADQVHRATGGGGQG